MDLFVVPTVGFDLLYAFVIVRLGRRDLVWINVTAERVARQLTEAFPWDEAPRYLIRDRDRIYGNVVTRRLRTMGIQAAPWQNGVAGPCRGKVILHWLGEMFDPALAGYWGSRDFQESRPRHRPCQVQCLRRASRGVD
jgi:Protein of unknown function (DUF993)